MKNGKWPVLGRQERTSRGEGACDWGVVVVVLEGVQGHGWTETCAACRWAPVMRKGERERKRLIFVEHARVRRGGVYRMRMIRRKDHMLSVILTAWTARS